MLQRFRAKKEQTMSNLLQPDEQYTDASPKGSVDVGIRSLVDEINQAPGCVTTSSCAGRIAVYLDGAPKSSNSANTGAATGGKGGGKWFYISHSPVDLGGLHEPGAVSELLGLPKNTNISYPSAEAEAVQFIHFKFEPMILHILCTTGRSAQAVLTAATISGFRESGISSLYDSKSQRTTPMVAVRSAGLAFDSIVAFQSADGRIFPMVEESYLRTLIHLANDRFDKNEIRKARFREAFDPQIGDRPFDHSDYEPAKVRRRREQSKTDEHLARQMEIRAGSGSESTELINEQHSGDQEIHSGK